MTVDGDLPQAGGDPPRRLPGRDPTRDRLLLAQRQRQTAPPSLARDDTPVLVDRVVDRPGRPIEHPRDVADRLTELPTIPQLLALSREYSLPFRAIAAPSPQEKDMKCCAEGWDRGAIFRPPRRVPVSAETTLRSWQYPIRRECPSRKVDPCRIIVARGRGQCWIAPNVMEPGLLDHPLAFAWPRRLTPFSTWHEHIPFAMSLVSRLRPRTIVELGTHYGDSYCSFAQAVDELGLPTRCYAVDTWRGDPQTGFYGPEVLDDLRSHHDRLYGRFSTLMQCEFDEAVGEFTNGSIDLLHIDGFHTYEAVKHDFQTWAPRLGEAGVVLLHDTNERLGDFGVWRLFAELNEKYPTLEFFHGHGLGVVGVGANPPTGVAEFLGVSNGQLDLVRRFYSQLGRRLTVEEELAGHKSQVVNQELRMRDLSGQADTLRARLQSSEEQVRDLSGQVDTLRARLQSSEEQVRDFSGQVDTLRARLQSSEEQVRMTEARFTAEREDSNLVRQSLAALERELADWRAWESSAGWKLFMAATETRSRLAPTGTRRDRIVRQVLDRVAGARPSYSSLGADDLFHSAFKAILFVSGAPEVSRRYRCDFQAEQLEWLGASVDVAVYGRVDLAHVIDRFGCFVLHRVPFGPDVERFLEEARRRGKAVLFDTDDLTFDPEAAPYVAALEAMSEDDRELYVRGLHRYRATMSRCDAVIVSTKPLARLAREVHDNVVVAPNVASSALAAAADEARERIGRGASSAGGPLTVAYLSGTPTHDRDFLEAADAVLALLGSRPEARFVAVGPLTLDARFDAFADRIRRLPLQPWEELPALLAQIDVNLAPLQGENPFTESKSCIKYIEAGLLGVPTIASPRADFLRAIEHGRNGLLAETKEDWERALLELADDADARLSLGETARADVRQHHLTGAQAPRLYDLVARLACRAGTGEPLTVNWVLLAPIAQNSGGYRNIFRIADQLALAGHTVRVCVDPVAHLQGLSDREIESFIDEAFRPIGVEVVVGHDRLPPADVSVATFWKTAATVAQHDGSLFKAYYIQDFEPEFYERSDPQYHAAAETYELPLRPICLGRHLASRIEGVTGKPAQCIDFALDEPFTLRIDPAERGDPVRVLFFARPGLRRRGFQVGVESLRLLKAEHPEVHVDFFGTPTNQLGTIPFDFRNLGVLSPQEVARAMNETHILLTLSLTNISNVPYEGMACGCAVVDVNTPNVTEMVPPGACLLADAEPHALSEALKRLVRDAGLRQRLTGVATAAMKDRSWQRTASQFEQILFDLCFLRLESHSRELRPERAVAKVAAN